MGLIILQINPLTTTPIPPQGGRENEMKGYIDREKIELKVECIDLLEKIVAEFKENPISVQNFDLRLIDRAEYAVKRLREIGP